MNSKTPTTLATMAKPFTVISYNLHGINQGESLLKDIFINYLPDVVFVQEHWLSSINMHNLLSMSTNYYCLSTSAMEQSIQCGILRGRPFGGVAIFFANELSDRVQIISLADRYIIARWSNIIFVNIYAPTADKKYDQFCELQSILSVISAELSANTSGGDLIIFGGDFNTELSKTSDISSLYTSFFGDHCLIPVFGKSKGANYTFVNSSNHFSCIDYFAVSEHVIKSLDGLEIMDIEPNLSDHLPIKITLSDSVTVNLHAKQSDGKPITKPNAVVKQLRWDHGDLMQYYYCTYNGLYAVFDRVNSFYNVHNILSNNVFTIDPVTRDEAITIIESSYIDIIKVLHDAATSCIPCVPKNFFKYWWDQELQALKDQSIAAHREWVGQGRPRQGIYFDNNKDAKYKYKSRLKQSKGEDNRSISNSLHDALLRKDQSSFWKMWKSKFPAKRTDIPHSIDGATDHAEIANNFAKSFESCCYSKATGVQCDSFREKYMEHVFNNDCDLFNANCLFTVEGVDIIVSELKRGKAAGMDGLTAEHVIHSHPVMIALLVKLFNLMLRYNYVPDDFGVGLCIPLLKNSEAKNRASVDGYRGITISPVISKIFEIGIGEKLEEYLKTSELQFGFKKKMSCSHAIYSVKTVVDHFVKRGSTVNLCAMDLSKAFDRVNHYCLLDKLIDRRIPVSFILLLECWYCKLFIHVRWCDTLSDRVQLRAGVRQGSTLSPIFFSIYVDVILITLHNSKFGCHIRGMFAGAFMYADDLLLVSANVTELQKMIGLCKAVLDDIGMLINVNKTMCMRVGAKFNAICANIILDNQPLSWVRTIRYLGLFIESNTSFKISLNDARKRFYIAANSVVSKIHKDNITVILSLIASFCTPILLYALEAVILNKSETQRLDNPFNMVFNKLFGTFDKSIIKSCQYHCGYLPFSLLHDLKYLRFARKLNNFQDINSFVYNLFRLSGLDDFVSVAIKYDVDINDSEGTITKKIWNTFSRALFDDSFVA